MVYYLWREFRSSVKYVVLFEKSNDSMLSMKWMEFFIFLVLGVYDEMRFASVLAALSVNFLLMLPL